MRGGCSVGLYARHDARSGGMVLTELFRTGGRFRARIMVHDGQGWNVRPAGAKGKAPEKMLSLPKLPKHAPICATGAMAAQGLVAPEKT